VAEAGDKDDIGGARPGQPVLVEAAFDNIATDGLDGMTMRRVANAAGCSLGTLSYHFNSREDLISAVFTDHILPAIHAQQSERRSPDPVAAFMNDIKAALPFGGSAEKIWRVRLELTGFSARNPKFRALAARAQQTHQQQLVKAYDRLVSLNRLSDTSSVSLLARQTAAMETGTAMTMMQMKPTERAEPAEALLAWITALFK
jgi:AcrR family transcriptional regulator